MKCSVDVKNRVKRSQGQMQGVLQMMEEDCGCAEIVNQLKAIKASIEKTIGLITATNLIQTIEEKNQITLENVEEAVNLIVKGM